MLLFGVCIKCNMVILDMTIWMVCCQNFWIENWSVKQ